MYQNSFFVCFPSSLTMNMAHHEAEFNAFFSWNFLVDFLHIYISTRWNKKSKEWIKKKLYMNWQKSETNFTHNRFYSLCSFFFFLALALFSLLFSPFNGVTKHTEKWLSTATNNNYCLSIHISQYNTPLSKRLMKTSPINVATMQK